MQTRWIRDQRGVTDLSSQARDAADTPGTLKIRSGSAGNGRFTTVTYTTASTPQLTRAAIANSAAGATCAAAS